MLRFVRRATALFLLLLFFCWQAAQAKIIYVDADATGAADGSSWADAYTDLQDALAAAMSGDEIWVAEGTYVPTAGTDRTIAFELISGVALYGGFDGTETARSQRDYVNHVTILSGDLNGDDGSGGSNAENSYTVVVGSGTDATAVLDGLTVTAGNASSNSNSALGNGAGMYNSGGSPTVANVIFIANAAILNGGGMYNTSSSPALTDVTFSNNSTYNTAVGLGGGAMFNTSGSNPTLTNVTFAGNAADLSGGGMYNSSSHPTLDNVTFTGNTATASSSSFGGGMYNSASSPVIDGTTFSNNAARHGGGMYNTGGSTPTITNSTFEDNTATVVGTSDGGGMYNTGSGTNPSISTSTFRDNTASSGGGGIYTHSSATVTVADVLFDGNRAVSGGGGGLGGDASVTNSTFTNNRAVFGGGMSGSGSVSGTTFTGNIGTFGGGIRMSGGTVEDCTFTGNTASGSSSSGGGASLDGSTSFLGNTLVGNTGSHPTSLGGGLYIGGSGAVVVNNVIRENTTGQEGGGVYVLAAPATFANNTILDNHAPTGAGIYARNTTMTVANSVVWGNTTAWLAKNAFSTITVSHSIVDGGLSGASDGGGNVFIHPLYGDAEGRLTPGSPGIDAGDNSAVPGSVTTDHDGNARIQNGTVDIGAFEGAITCPASSTAIHVAAGATGSGASWAAPMGALRAAIPLAAGCGLGEVWVQQGTYVPTDNGIRGLSFDLIDGAAVYGGFDGTETMRDERDVQAHPTILSGDLDGDDPPGAAPKTSTNAENSYHVVRCVASSGCTGATAVLDGVTISGGNASEFSGANQHGGGVYNASASPTYANLVITGNSAYRRGGGMYNTNSSPTITETTFSNNNTTVGGSGSGGGGMANANNSSSLIRNSTFTGNTAMGGGSGGALEFDTGSSPVIIGSTFENNSAGSGGAVFGNGTCSPVVLSSIFRNNEAATGGAIYALSSGITIEIVNSLFHENTATTGRGGGFYSPQGGQSSVINSTFAQNDAGDRGGAIYFNTGTHTVRNGILWGNTAGVAGTTQIGGATATVTYSIVQDAYSGTANSADDPLFVDPAAGNFRVQAGSPALDGGNNADLPADAHDLDGDSDTAETLPLALGGTARIVDNDGDAGTPAIVDRGAYEAPTSVLLPVELVRFEAQFYGATVVLQWATASETNNAGFEVQQADEVAAWRVLGFVEGHGTTNEPRQYAFQVYDLAPGRHRFRLRQLDYDGAFAYSPEVEVMVEMTAPVLLAPVYPNPARGDAHLLFSVARAAAVRVVLFDALGRVVRLLYDGRSPAGVTQRVHVPGDGLPAGLYFVRLTGDGGLRAARRFVLLR